MRSWFKDIPLKEEGRITTFDYDIGIAKEGAFNGDVRANQLVCKFDGLMRTIDYMENNLNKFGNRKSTKHDSSYEKRESKDWTQFETYDIAVENMRKHPEAFRHFDEWDMRLHDEESVGNQIDYEQQGDFIDIGKVLMGEPECFGVMRGDKIENRFCSIVVNGNAQASVSKDTISRKASRVLRLVDMLELNGVRCELAVIFTTHQLHCEIVIKQFNDPLDINDIAIALSPDFFRWVIFRYTEHSSRKDSGYGRPLRCTLASWVDEDADNTIYVDACTYGTSLEDVVKEFDELEKQIRENEFASGKNYKVL